MIIWISIGGVFLIYTVAYFALVLGGAKDVIIRVPPAPEPWSKGESDERA